MRILKITDDQLSAFAQALDLLVRSNGLQVAPQCLALLDILKASEEEKESSEPVEDGSN